MSNRNRLNLNLPAKPQRPTAKQRTSAEPTPPRHRAARKVVRRRVVKRVDQARGGRVTRTTYSGRRRTAQADIVVDQTLPTMQARTTLPLEIVAALRALLPLHNFVEIGDPVQDAPVVAGLFPEVVTLQPTESPTLTEQMAAFPHATCLYGDRSQVLSNVQKSLRGRSLFWATIEDAMEYPFLLGDGDQADVLMLRITGGLSPQQRQRITAWAAINPWSVVFIYNDILITVELLPRVAAWFNAFRHSHTGKTLQILSCEPSPSASTTPANSK